MKTLTKTIATAALIFATTTPAIAGISPGIVNDIKAAAGSSTNVTVDVDGDTVTLTGYVEDYYALRSLERVAKTNGANNVVVNVIRSE